MPKQLLIATGNPGKLHELKVLLGSLELEIISIDQAGVFYDIAETGSTFEENARLKAATLANQSGILTLADDSGLEVDALGGAPGVISARYAGERATDSQRNAYLVSQLEGIHYHERTARFRCVIAICLPQIETVAFHGVCEGYVAMRPVGRLNFGYDPVFYLPELAKTLAQIPRGKKNEISHRSKAVRQALPYLQSYCRS